MIDDTAFMKARGDMRKRGATQEQLDEFTRRHAPKVFNERHGR